MKPVAQRVLETLHSKENLQIKSTKSLYSYKKSGSAIQGTKVKQI